MNAISRNPFRPRQRGTLREIEILRLDVEGLTQHLDAIAGILLACLHDGANVGFVLPFDLNQARAFWVEKIGPGLAANTRIVLAAIAETLYFSLGYERAGHIPGYAREPNEERFVGTTIMYKVLPDSP